jgi:hypothetical protein
MTSSPATNPGLQAQRVRAVADSIMAQTAPYPPTPGARYLLPCPLLGTGGLYEYVLVDAAQARQWLLSGPCVSYVTHPLLRLALERLVGIVTPLPTREPWPVLGYHDDALVFQVEGYETLPQHLRGSSQRLRTLLEEGRWTLGLLRKLA